jgi:hypothetical protein
MRKDGALLFVGIVLAALAGCSSSSSSGSGSEGTGSPPNFDALQQTLTTPTGTLQPGQESSVATEYGKQQGAMEENPFGSGSVSSNAYGARLYAQTLRIAAGGGDACSGAFDNGGKGSCACPGGGTVAFDIPAGGMDAAFSSNKQGPISVTVSLAASQCSDGEGRSFDGSAYMRMKSTKADNSDIVVVEALHLTVTGGTNPGRYDVDFLLDMASVPQRIVFAVDVPDGKVLVSGTYDRKTKTGELDITDKKGQTKCVVTNGSGTCTAPDGTTRSVSL